MSIGRSMIRGLKRLERALSTPLNDPQKKPPFFTWKGNDYVCTNTTQTSGKRLGIGGFSLLDDLVLYVRKELIPTPTDADPGIQKKDSIIFKGVTYKVDTIDTPAGEAFVKLSCNGPNRGA